MKSGVVNFANEILEMQDEIFFLRKENVRLQKYEQLYNELLNESSDHGKKMMYSLTKLCLTPGVVEALQNNSVTKVQ